MYRYREEKQSLTKERIVNDLRADLDLVLRLDVIMAVRLVASCAIFSMLLLFISFSYDHIGFTIAQCVLWGLVLLCIAYTTGKVYSRRRTLERRTFTVVEDEVARMVEDEFNPKRYVIRGLGGSYQNVFYFEHFGRVVVGKEMFDYTSEGDRFYLVLFDDAKDSPARLYNTRMYKYRENT